MAAKKVGEVKAILSSKVCRDEMMECDEHEIVSRISSLLGEKPCEMCKAEAIFNEMKYDIARFIIAHEYYSQVSDVNDNLLLWLDEKTSPEGVKKLVETIEKYMK